MNMREELMELLDGKAGILGVGNVPIVIHGKMELHWFRWAIRQPWFKAWIKRKFPDCPIEV